jgi:hypothetical protein
VIFSQHFFVGRKNYLAAFERFSRIAADNSRQVNARDRCEADGAAQKEPGALLRDSESLMITPLGRSITHSVQQIASGPMQLSLADPSLVDPQPALHMIDLRWVTKMTIKATPSADNHPFLL